ncbi:hypothetical protein [Noviherbaspirillum sedimenti]|uniref:DUF4148 domain-containing protein n=1 Tax=Noviherbaspirillum sedimenti TaxID=2320865 RepID=A0A3A3G529_9BURK|nr:hypothetical protein [Noviherbaspirillum sedimenti]RJG03613.1 hypothetical protein D3878_20120 [Noviherbaspirillum sedimenti]
MNAKKLIATVAATLCAASAYAVETPEVTFQNSLTPYEVTAQDKGVSSGPDIQAANASAGAGIGKQATPAVNFANTMEPWVVTAQDPASSATRK